MANIIECITGLVGLSQRECQCNGCEALNNESASGLFVDDPIDGIPLQWATHSLDCSKTLWPVLEAARNHGIMQLYQEFNIAFTRNNRQLINNFVGTLGEGEASGKVNKLLTPAGDFVGAELRPVVRFRGASMTITQIGLYVDTAGDYEVFIKNVETDVVVSSVLVTAVADKKSMVTLTDPIELPITDYAGNPIMYRLEYDRNGARPWNVLWNCLCTSAKKQHLDFILPLGYAYDGTTYAYDTVNSMGLYITISIGCRSENWLCDVVKIQNEPFTSVYGKTLQLMAIRALLQYVLKSGNINLWTMIAEEQAPYHLCRLGKEITYRIEWLAVNAPQWVADCYGCRDTIAKGAIIV